MTRNSLDWPVGQIPIVRTGRSSAQFGNTPRNSGAFAVRFPVRPEFLGGNCLRPLGALLCSRQFALDYITARSRAGFPCRGELQSTTRILLHLSLGAFDQRAHVLRA